MIKSVQAITLLLIVFFGFIGVALPYPILAHLFLHSDSISFISLDVAADYRHILFGFTLAAYPLAQFFGSPILGSLSDRFGQEIIDPHYFWDQCWLFTVWFGDIF